MTCAPEVLEGLISYGLHTLCFFFFFVKGAEEIISRRACQLKIENTRSHAKDMQNSQLCSLCKLVFVKKYITGVPDAVCELFQHTQTLFASFTCVAVSTAREGGCDALQSLKKTQTTTKKKNPTIDHCSLLI